MTGFLIAIDGEGTAGKSTLAEKLKSLLPNSAVVGIDYFCYPPSGRAGEWWGDGVEGYGFDWQRLRDQILIPFARGDKNIRYDSLNWDNFQLEELSLPDADILIVEGLTTLRRELRDVYDFSIWLTSDDENRMKRVVERGDSEMVGHWHREFLPLNKQYVGEHRPQDAADIVFHSLAATPDDFGILLKEIESRRVAAPHKKMTHKGLQHA